jgi:hypothetical protein
VAFLNSNLGTLQVGIRIVFRNFAVVETLQWGNMTSIGGWVCYIMVLEIFVSVGNGVHYELVSEPTFNIEHAWDEYLIKE